MLQWGLITDATCVLCNAASECNYSKTIWQSCMKVIHYATSNYHLPEVIEMASNHSRGSRRKHQLYNMFFVESVYHIWLQRNKIVFDNQLWSIQQVFRVILFHIACRVDPQINELLLM